MKLAKRLGISYPLLKWPEPSAVTELEWQLEGWPECKKFLLTFWKLGFVIGIPILTATKIWLPEGFIPALFGLLALCSFLPTVLSLEMWLSTKTGTLCSIHKGGIVKGAGRQSSMLKWGNIVGHQFSDHADLPKVRVLRMETRSGEESKHQYCFDPDEVSENQIREFYRSVSRRIIHFVNSAAGYDNAGKNKQKSLAKPKFARLFLFAKFYRSNAALISISCSLRWLAALPVAGLALRSR